MALRILSGTVLVPRGSREGRVVIGFDPFEITDASDPAIELVKKREVGRAGRLLAPPVSMVAPRQFSTQAAAPGPITFKGRISDAATREALTITWNNSDGRVDQEEIPFTVIGEVPDRRVRRVR